MASHEVTRIETTKHPSIFDPFEKRGNVASELQNRILEGYFGPTASRDRSRAFQYNVENFSHIHDHLIRYRPLLSNDSIKSLHKRTVRDLRAYGRWRELPWSHEYEMAQLKNEWETIPKGGQEEFEWTERAVALTAAGFEKFKRQNGDINFKLRPNQLHYLTLLLLNKGKYDFGALETDARGVELFTGEGKTYGFGLIAPIMAMRGETVHVIEPNYTSAINHANQMAKFYEEFFHIETGAVTSMPEKDGFTKKIIVEKDGKMKDVHEINTDTKSYVYVDGKMRENKGRSGRVNAWKQKIVYTVAESVAFDYLRDHQIGQEEKTGLPDLNTVSALVAEADDLLIDGARNPFIISETTKGGEAWDKLSFIMGLESSFTGEGWTDEAKRTFTKNITFSLWGNLFEKKREGYFKEGEGKDYLVIGRQFKDSMQMSVRTMELTVEALKHVFGYDEEGETTAILASTRRLFHSWGAQDLLTQDGLENMVANIKGAYRFHDPKSEKKAVSLVMQSMSKGIRKDILQADIQEIITEDHKKAIWDSIHKITNTSIPIAGEEEGKETMGGLARVQKLFHSWGAQDLLTQDGLENMVANIKGAYRFHDAKNEKSAENLIRQSLSKGGTPKNVLLSDIENIIKQDNERAKILKVFCPENREVMGEVLNWVVDNQPIIDAATEVLFGMRESADYLTGKKPVLLDDYGFPLEKRNIHDIKHIFLQLQNIWLNAGMDKRPLTSEQLQTMRDQRAGEVEVAQSTDRITIPVLFRKYGKLRFSSGSLLPAASSFSDLYEAEVLGVERHLPVPEIPYPEQKKKSLLTRCLDGGVAQVRFTSEVRRRLELAMKAQEIRKTGKTGIFIVPDIEFAQQLKSIIPDAELATGAEELRDRGTLDKVTSSGTPGKMIITTWIAHRDIDVKLTPEVIKNGGLDNIVCGVLPTERGLWQALQRAVRGDVPGTRTLMLTPEDFSPIENSTLLEGASRVSLIRKDPNIVHKEHIARVKKEWSQALSNDVGAMEKLFKQYLVHLRLQEEHMKNQLLQTYIRDNRLELWQRLYLERQRQILEESENNNRLVDEAQQMTDQLISKDLRLPVTKPTLVVEPSALVLNVPSYSKPSIISESPLVVKPASMTTSTTVRRLPKERKEDRLEEVLSRLERKYGFYLPTDGTPAIFRNQIRIRSLRNGWSIFLQFLEEDFEHFLMDYSYINLTIDQKKNIYEARISQMFDEEETPFGKFPGDLPITTT